MFNVFRNYSLLLLVILGLVVMMLTVYFFFDTKPEGKEKDEKTSDSNSGAKQEDVLKKDRRKKSIFKRETKNKDTDPQEETKKSADGSDETKAKDSDEKKSDESETQDKPKLIFRKSKTGDSSQKKLRQSKNSKSIEKVYQKAPSKKKLEKNSDLSPSITEEELLEKNVFVKTSKNVYKLVKRDENTELQAFQDELEDALEAYQGGDPEMDDLKSQLLKQKHGHFDKSRRLSRCIDENEFDDMFVSHIGEKYLNINTERHLNIDDNFNERLFRRASQTLSNSSIKIRGNGDVNTKLLVSESERDNAQREELTRLILEKDQDDHEEDELLGNYDDSEMLTDINAKNLILGQMLMTRKRAKK